MEQRDINYIMEAHGQNPRKPSKAFRKWNGETPYSVHPIWCASMIESETSLEPTQRREGSQVLLYHDLLEDTTRLLPDWISERVEDLIRHMTFKGGSRQEMKQIWTKSPEIRLYKLYDKTSNLLDGIWMDKKKIEVYSAYTDKLITDVEKNYGQLNITRIAKAITESEKY